MYSRLSIMDTKRSGKKNPRVVQAAIGHIDQNLHISMQKQQNNERIYTKPGRIRYQLDTDLLDRLIVVFGVDKVCDSQIEPYLFFARVGVDTNDTTCLVESGPFYHRKANCTQ